MACAVETCEVVDRRSPAARAFWTSELAAKGLMGVGERVWREKREGYFLGALAAPGPAATLALRSPEWPWKVRVGANSPSL